VTKGADFFQKNLAKKKNTTFYTNINNIVVWYFRNPDENVAKQGGVVSTGFWDQKTGRKGPPKIRPILPPLLGGVEMTPFWGGQKWGQSTPP